VLFSGKQSKSSSQTTVDSVQGDAKSSTEVLSEMYVLLALFLFQQTVSEVG